jgi:tRNA pseudouridine55 synthase
LLVDKPAGVTSHDVVGKVRRIFGQREVGHTGTLDPFATGLLVLALGRATRIARFVEAEEKRYTGTVRLGRATTTYDLEGDVTGEKEVGLIERSVIDRALTSLTGTIQQKAPAFSAIKVDGERLYAKARRGEEVDAPVRTVTIHQLSLVEMALPDLVIETRVSKGTYIRSLAVQLGEALGLPAHLVALRRTAVGAHLVSAAKTIEQLEGRAEELVPIEAALPQLSAIRCDEKLAKDVRHGRPLLADAIQGRVEGALSDGAELRLVDENGSVLGIGVFSAGKRAVSYACVLTPPDQGP